MLIYLELKIKEVSIELYIIQNSCYVFISYIWDSLYKINRIIDLGGRGRGIMRYMEEQGDLHLFFNYKIHLI